MPQPNKQRQNQGFTLIEMIVALSIFALISVAGLMLLQGTIKSSSQVKQATTQLTALQKTLWLFEQDLQQAVIRQNIQGTSSTRSSDFIITHPTSERAFSVTFVKGNNPIPGSLTQSSELLWVEWYLDHKQLKRRTWRPFSQAENPQYISDSVLLSDVSHFDLRAYSAAQKLSAPIETFKKLPAGLVYQFSVPRYGVIERTLILADIL